MEKSWRRLGGWVAVIGVVWILGIEPAKAVDLYSNDGHYLGHLGGSPYDPNSTNNPYGKYGSPYSKDSINNPYGKYGSPYSMQSPNDPYGWSQGSGMKGFQGMKGTSGWGQ